MRRIRYPLGAHFLHISRILRVNPLAGRLLVLLVLGRLVQAGTPDAR